MMSAEKKYERFNLQHRVQHITFFTSFIILALTGLPIKYAGTGWSMAIAGAVGGGDNLLYIHLFGASMMIAASINHLLYLAVGAIVGEFSLAVVPTPKDFKDLYHNISYQLGLVKEPPKYGRYSYKEKFDYWAVFWGMFIMAGSGIMMWFPERAAGLFPKWFLDAARSAHSDEAMLAILAIFVWHFYNVHFSPRVFPMSFVWLHGKLTRREMEEEHPLALPEYEETEKRRAAREAAREANKHMTDLNAGRY